MSTGALRTYRSGEDGQDEVSIGEGHKFEYRAFFDVAAPLEFSSTSFDPWA